MKTLFISYSWSDGSGYADELERQLSDYFEVKRDKSQLNANDDITQFMEGVIECDYVIVVLTAEYVKSINCMYEIATLSEQDDWHEKTMVLIVDESIYGFERKIEILNYWELKKSYINNQATEKEAYNVTFAEDIKALDKINERLGSILKGISRFKNPSQIAIVNEMVRKSRNKDNSEKSQNELSHNEEIVMEIIRKYGDCSLDELSKNSNFTEATVRRYVSRLIKKNMVMRVGTGRNRNYKAVE
jgi:uncharacterized membrane protein